MFNLERYSVSLSERLAHSATLLIRISLQDLLHAGASYLRVHQKGFGAVGVSAKYGKRSFARYPILWGMKEVGALPNPDPTDTAPWNKEQIPTSDIHIDAELEASKPGLKKEAQKWAGLTEDPKADLFVFVGRWSQQKGVDSIADVFPSVLEQHPQVQLICIGPVIDLYGKFAALKLAKMMEVYPGRVFSKPEFTALPPYIFSGADFALMPSRDEPFGLVAVEFGRKGALCVGARVGGLGQMPGWWFTIESTTTKHFMHQFKIAIQGALSSKPEVRAIMRARAAKQRFPVAQWVEDLEKLQSTAIEISERQATKSSRQSLISMTPSSHTPAQSRKNTPNQSRKATPMHSRNASRASSPVRDDIVPPLPNGGLGSRLGPGSRRKRVNKKRQSGTISAPISEAEESSDEEVRGRSSKRYSRSQAPSRLPSPQLYSSSNFDQEHSPVNWPFAAPTNVHAAATPVDQHLSGDWAPESGGQLTKGHNSAVSLLSLADVKGDKTDYKLQNVSPFFTDPKKEFTDIFEQKLNKLNGKTSEDTLCIEEYLIKSEKQWFGKLRAAEMGRSPLATPKRSPAPSVHHMDRDRNSAAVSSIADGGRLEENSNEKVPPSDDQNFDEFLLGDNYKPPTGLKHVLRLKIGDWPLYSILLALVSFSISRYSHKPT